MEMGCQSINVLLCYKRVAIFMPSWPLRGDHEWYDPLESFVFVLYFEVAELKVWQLGDVTCSY